MLQTATRSATELDWHSLGGYSFQEQGRKVLMANANRQRNVRGGSASSGGAAQPLGFRNHLGQIDHATDSLAHSATSLGVAQSTYAPYVSATVASSSDAHHWPPQATTLQTAHLDNDNAGHYQAETWQQAANQYHTGIPRRSARLPQNPSIEISTAFDTLNTHHPAPQAVLYPQTYLAVNSYPMIYDNQIPQMAEVAAPVSPVSHHSGHSRTVTPLPESNARKRSYSEQSGDARSPITTSLGEYATNEPVVRKSRTVKRPDAPMNEDHKYICNISSECAGLAFDRKCEWGKHMDKHDRPYRCPYPACAKLLGFTYSGGLLRHEREVHNKHGGPKALLMCPHPSCKRHSDKGFTRKENLQEHIRRVHPETTDSDVAPSLDQLEPASALSSGAAASADELYVAAALNGTKRKRSDADSAAGELEDLREQVRRLRTENEAKSAIIQRLEEDGRNQSARLALLEHTMQQQQHVIR